MPDTVFPTAVTRIAMLGDVHMNSRWTVSAVIQAARQGAHVIMQLGDFGYTFGDTFVEAVSEACRQNGIVLVFVDGNHENHHYLKTGQPGDPRLREIAPGILHATRGFRWEWDGVRFLALGGAHSVDADHRRRYGFLWHKEETITAWQAQAAISGGPVDVLVSHDCPAGVDIPGLTDGWPEFEIALADKHRSLLRTVVDKVRPYRIFHGHYHVRYQRFVDFGWGPMIVDGLDRDGDDMKQNLVIVETEDLRRVPAGSAG
ncbi:MAG: metallophosphatase [Mycobacterium sp.]